MDDNIISKEHLPGNLNFLHEANTHALIDWLYANKNEEELQAIFPIVWKFLEKRIHEHLNEAGEVDFDSGLMLPIHRVFFIRGDGRVPLSVVKLLIIEVHPQGLNTQTAVTEYHCIMLSDAVTASAFVRSFTAALLRQQQLLRPRCWEILLYSSKLTTLLCRHSVDEWLEAAESDFMPALMRVEALNQEQITSQNAKKVLMKVVANYHCVPELPNEATIAAVESHPACGVLAPRLEPGKDRFILNHALAANCPLFLVKTLLDVFPNQVHQEDPDRRLPLHIAVKSRHGAFVRFLAKACPEAMSMADPVTGHLPVEQALLNIGVDGSLESIDVVDALLRADPAFLRQAGRAANAQD